MTIIVNRHECILFVHYTLSPEIYTYRHTLSLHDALPISLGTGKTCFARARIRQLAGPGTEVPSPTFNLVLTYDIDGVTLWHFDLYRIDDPRALDELGLDDALADGISLIEWPDRLGTATPAAALRSEERRVGKEGVSTCRSRGSPEH